MFYVVDQSILSGFFFHNMYNLNKTISIIYQNFFPGLSMNVLKTGQGPDTCLLLDLSGSMVGEPFNEMMVTV